MLNTERGLPGRRGESSYPRRQAETSSDTLEDDFLSDVTRAAPCRWLDCHLFAQEKTRPEERKVLVNASIHLFYVFIKKKKKKKSQA